VWLYGYRRENNGEMVGNESASGSSSGPTNTKDPKSESAEPGISGSSSFWDCRRSGVSYRCNLK
jgi:hypothetical protein